MMHWIKTTTQLPKEDVDVLLWWSKDLPYDIGSLFDKENNRWQSSNGDMYEFDIAPEYWMTLPAEPNNQ